MRRLKIILLIPALAYGAALGYLWFEVKSGADNLSDMASPFAYITYGSVHVSLIGDEVGLDNVVIRPITGQDVFRIEKLRFSAPNILYFISANKNLERGELPENLGMRLDRVHLDINSEIFSMLDQMPRQGEATDAGGMRILSNLEAYGCGDIDAFTLDDYRKMGIDAIVMNIGVNLGYDKEDNTGRVTVNASAEGLNSIELRAELKSGKNLSKAMAESGIPRLTLSLHDTGYYKLRNAYCAGLNNSDDENYVDRHLRVMSKKLDAKFPEAALAAYKQFMLEGGAMDVGINPSSTVDPNGLKYYAAENIVEMLGLDLSINGKSVEFNQVQWTGSRPQVSIASAATREKSLSRPASGTPPRPTVKTTRTPAAPVFKDIGVADAGKYINSMVEVSTLDGKVRHGLLEKVSAERIYLVIKVSAGTLMYPVESDKISKLRVIN